MQWSSPASTALEWDLSDDVMTVRLAGEVCTWSVSRLKPVLDAAVLSLDPSEISIDLSAVSFFDARGVSLLVDLTERTRCERRTCHIVDASGPARRVLTMCGFGLVGDVDIAHPSSA